MPNYRSWECGLEGLLIAKLQKVGVNLVGLMIAKLQKVGVWFGGFSNFESTEGGSVVWRVC